MHGYCFGLVLKFAGDVLIVGLVGLVGWPRSLPILITATSHRPFADFASENSMCLASCTRRNTQLTQLTQLLGSCNLLCVAQALNLIPAASAGFLPRKYNPVSCLNRRRVFRIVGRAEVAGYDVHGGFEVMTERQARILGPRQVQPFDVLANLFPNFRGLSGVGIVLPEDLIQLVKTFV